MNLTRISDTVIEVFYGGFQRAEAMQLVRDAIAAGIFNDLGSGSNIDLCVITKDKTDYLRTFDEANVKGRR
jgi:20S proteasome subunit beta 2